MDTLTKRVFDEIDMLADKYLGVLVDACNIESKSEDKEGVDKVGEYFARIAHELGYDVCKREFERAGNVYSFTMNSDGDKKMISLSGHMDTVHVKGSFGYPPVRIEGDYVYGPGVNDCKGNIATELLAMEALKRAGYTGRPVRLILQSDEEVNSSLSDKKSLEFMVEQAKGSAAFLNAENIGPARKLTVARKGIVSYKITITGKKIHAGSCTLGANALKEAAHKVIAFEEGNDLDGITFNCGVLNGGSAPNVVPDYCEMLVEYRFKTMEQKMQADKKFRNITETVYVPGTETCCELISDRLPMEPNPKNLALAETINDICSAIGIEPFGTAQSPGGADSAYPSLAGIPTIDSIGLEGADCHTLNECARISSMAEMAKVAAAIILHFPD